MSVLRQSSGRSPSTTAIIAGAVALGLVAVVVWFGLFARGAPLQRSPVGFDGLAVWLRAEGLNARPYEGWTSIDNALVGLRILPLFDTVLDQARRRPANAEELLVQQSEVDVSGWVVRRKLSRLPTLLVLPKWRTSMRLSNRAHPDFLVDEASLSRLLRAVSPELGRVSRSGEAFASFPVAGDPEGPDATLYAPQTATAGPCEPLVGTREAMVLGRCQAPVRIARGPGEGAQLLSFHLLVDPDLMNNHGLRLGDNAGVSAEVINELSSGLVVLIDYTTALIPFQNDAVRRRDLEWSDLLRFFGEPFRFLWVGLAGLAALVLWRSFVRYGAPLPRPSPHTASKNVAIDAKARLLRLSGHDGDVIAAYVDARLKRLAQDVLGPKARTADAALNALITRLQRQDEGLANALSSAAGVAKRVDLGVSTAEMAEALDRFENVVEKVLDDFGRTRPRA
ncbi:MAG: hypothetical protein AAGF45_00125 [Pseudomonadota bacterium]